MIKRFWKLMKQSTDLNVKPFPMANTIQHQNHAFSSQSMLSNSSMTTVKLAISQCTAQLENEKVPEASLHAEYMVAEIIGKPRHVLQKFLDNQVSEKMIQKLDQMMMCRLSRMPLQYIIGNWDFYNITLNLRPPVFIPRPETERIVDLSLKFLENIENPQILDICCGSGAIGLAILKENKQAYCQAIDQSKYAIELSVENAKSLHLENRYKTEIGKITDENFPIQKLKFDLVVANPPYVLRKDVLELQPEIKLYEDLRALDGGKDGLDVIKPILQNAPHLLKQHGKLILEVDPCHVHLIPSWMETEGIQLKMEEIVKDYGDHDRFIVFTLL